MKKRLLVIGTVMTLLLSVPVYASSNVEVGTNEEGQETTTITDQNGNTLVIEDLGVEFDEAEAELDEDDVDPETTEESSEETTTQESTETAVADENKDAEKTQEKKSSMPAIIVGGLALLAVAAFFVFKKKN